MRMRALMMGMLAVGLALAGCAPPPSQAPSPPPPIAQPVAPKPHADFADLPMGDIPVALIVPLSGPQARIGEILREAAELALFDAFDPRLKLHVYDSAGNPEQSAAAAQRAIDDGAMVILGPLFSASVQSVAPIAYAAGVPVISFSNDDAAAQPGVYMLGVQPGDEVRRVLEYAVRDHGIKRIAALLPDGAYGDAVREALLPVLSAESGELAAIEIYPRSPQALSAPVRRLAQYDRRRAWLVEEREFLSGLHDDLGDDLLAGLGNRETLSKSGYDAVLIAEGGEMLHVLASLLPIYDILPNQVQFLGLGLFQDDSLRREPPLHGAWYAADPDDAFQAFARRFADIHGRAPPRLAALGYDAMALAALLARNPVTAERFGEAAITDPNGFQGLSGLFRFGDNGLAERRLGVFEITADGPKTLSPAPASFQAPPAATAKLR